MRLLIVVPHQDRASGNWVTARRFAAGLASRGHAVALCDTAEGSEGLRRTVAGFRPELALLLHAWRSGNPWLAATVTCPFAVLLTGTDVNIGISDPDQAEVIAAVLQQATAIFAQNPAVVDELRRSHPQLATRIRFLPPATTLGDTPYILREELPLAPGAVIFLCPAGIRPVKGVLELLEMCEPLAGNGSPLRLLFCGPILDAAYGRRFLAAVAARPWAAWLGTVPPEAMPALLRQVDVIVSNSFSEGLPNALVEAAVLGRPILARDIPGNAAVVVDGENGLLYRDAAGFLAAARRLRDDSALRRTLSRPDSGRFAPEIEAAALETACREILATRQGSSSRGV